VGATDGDDDDGVICGSEQGKVYAGDPCSSFRTSKHVMSLPVYLHQLTAGCTQEAGTLGSKHNSCERSKRH
jgi:hypothetical protein